MPRAYTMRAVQPAAQQAVELTRRYLAWADASSLSHDVQEDPRFMHRGVDLLWERSSEQVLGVEVKGDRHAHRGNYFFELVSNLEKDTPGCFLYSVADVLAYVFLGEREVHHLPLSAVREWFLPRAKEFPLSSARTKLGPSAYTTVGALVPVRRVLREVEGVQVFAEQAGGAFARRAAKRPRKSS